MSSLRYLMNVEGISGCFNNLIYVSGAKIINNNKWPIVCYFGGDIQNFNDEMIKQNNHEFLSYSLENVAIQLSQRFNNYDIIIVQPSKMINSFSLYENFLKCIKPYGSPIYNDNDQSCFIHLQKLLINACKQIDLNKNTIEVNLIAFSKGQIVINQLARSLYQISPQLTKFTLNNLYLLDGGHSGTKDFWITQNKFIDSLIKHGCRNFYIGITDFQLQKPNNMRDEFEKFEQILYSINNVNVNKVYLKQNDFPNLSLINLHFKLLDYLFQNLL